ncbi:hypothetical protein PYCC9005_001421 [Savitreella phatthalungensis]
MLSARCIVFALLWSACRSQDINGATLVQQEAVANSISPVATKALDIQIPSQIDLAANVDLGTTDKTTTPTAEKLATTPAASGNVTSLGLTAAQSITGGSTIAPSTSSTAPEEGSPKSTTPPDSSRASSVNENASSGVPSSGRSSAIQMSSLLPMTSVSSSQPPETSATRSNTVAASNSPTIVDVLVMTTYVAMGSSSVPTTLSRTVIRVGTITGSSIAEITAALNAASQNNSDSGLSSTNKRIIIGVVAGVGGTVVLAAFASLLHRLFRKRKERVTEIRFASSAHSSDDARKFEADKLNTQKTKTKIGISQNF